MHKIRSILILLLVPFFLVSCENELEVINSFSNEADLARQIMRDAKIVVTDSGMVRVTIKAPIIMNYPSATEPYLEFTEGMHTIFYDKEGNPETEITAKYGIYYTQQALWEARDSVEVVNMNGEIMNTEQLFWDEKKKIIYSNTFVKVTRPDEIIVGEGFESNENFTRWKIKKIQGTIYLRNEQ